MRQNSPHWQASCSFGGKQHRMTTHEESLSRAKDVARDWYLGLMGKYRAGDSRREDLPRGSRAVHRRIRDDYAGRAQPDLCRGPQIPDQGPPKSFLRGHGCRRHHRRQDSRLPHPSNEKRHVARDQLRKAKVLREKATQNTSVKSRRREARCIRKSSAFARFSRPPTGTAGSIMPNLCARSKAPAKSRIARGSRRRNTSSFTRRRAHGRKPRAPPMAPAHRGSARLRAVHGQHRAAARRGARLEFRDVEIVADDATGKPSWKSKCAASAASATARACRGQCSRSASPEAAPALKSEPAMNRPTPAENTGCSADKICRHTCPAQPTLSFPDASRPIQGDSRRARLKTDREGNHRTAYSLRHTYICLRLMEGADIYQIAKNCRTSVEMIEKYYASHIKDTAGRRGDQRPQAANRQAVESRRNRRLRPRYGG